MRHSVALAVLATFLSTVAAAQTAEKDSAGCWAVANDSSFSGWRVVRGRGFTYCVPPKWKAIGSGNKTTDAVNWHFGAGEIHWDVGAPQLRPASDLQYRLRDQKDFYETIAGRGLKIRTYVLTGLPQQYFTQVTWAQTPIYFQGFAEDSKTAKEELQIFRTVRFDEN